MKQSNRDLEIIPQRLPERDFLGTGFCFKPRDSAIEIDTLIIHSCYVEEAILNPVLSDSDLNQNTVSENSVKVLLAEIDRLNSYDESTKLAKNYPQRCADLLFKACHDVISCDQNAELNPFSVAAISQIFRMHGVSAHYLIDRQGAIFEFVPPQMLAFHAGPSKMPRAEDGRESVNQFSIGVEFFASPEFPIVDEQYHSLAALTKKLRQEFPLKNFYGHSDIAPGRKTDPEGFDWKKYSQLAELQPSDFFPKIE